MEMQTNHSDNTLATLMALMMGNRNNDDGRNNRSDVWVIVFVIFALVILAWTMKGNKNENGIAEIAAAKMLTSDNNRGCGCGCGNSKADVYEALNHQSEQNQILSVKSEVGALGLLLTKQLGDNQTKTTEQIGAVKEQNAAMAALVSTLVQEKNENNTALKTAAYLGISPYALNR